MSLTTYAELQTAVGNWLGGRTDLSTYIPDFVTLFEAWANRRFRVRQMETTSTSLSFTAGSATLPTDYLAWRRFTHVGDTRMELDFVHPSYLQAAYPDTPAGEPRIFTIEGTTIKVRPTTVSATEFDYYQKIAALSGTVNWLYAAHPDIYLFGSLAESGDFTDDDEKLAKWIARRDQIADEIEQLHTRSSVGAMRVMGTVV